MWRMVGDDGWFGAEVDEVAGVPGEFPGDEVLGDAQSDVGGGGEGLGSAESRVVVVVGCGDEVEGAVVSGADQGDPGVGAPSDRVEGEVSGAGEDDESADCSLGSGELSGASVVADSVVDDEVSVVDVDADSVSVGDDDRPVSGVTVGVGEDALDMVEV